MASDEFANATQSFADWKDIMYIFHNGSDLANSITCLSRTLNSYGTRQQHLFGSQSKCKFVTFTKLILEVTFLSLEVMSHYINIKVKQ